MKIRRLTLREHAETNPATVLFAVGYMTIVLLITFFGAPWL